MVDIKSLSCVYDTRNECLSSIMLSHFKCVKFENHVTVKYEVVNQSAEKMNKRSSFMVK